MHWNRVVLMCVGCGLLLAVAVGCSPTATENSGADAQQQSPDDRPPADQLRTDEPTGAAQQDAHDTPTHGDEPHKTPHKENRLAGETSPYLLLHKHNPVDWYPWGAEALAKAKRENKLIFLSIGYSSCHWCHVMERESFMDDGIAALLNKNFVCIKVDREERPDVDDVYMTALHVMGQSGGWPLSMFLTPDAKPIVGGTYFPRATFADLLKESTRIWAEKPDALRKQADTLSRFVQENVRARPTERDTLDTQAAHKLHDALADQFDAEHGGFGYSAVDAQRPKFPEPSNLAFLLDFIETHASADSDQAEKVENARAMLTTTLDKMAAGGIWDHVGGGFHRYSTDRFWHVPHFEKMLYDNGQLASVYARAFALTGNPEYREVVRRIVDFSDREMRDAKGGYYSALDAESDGKEGGFYIWQLDELRETIGDDDFELAKKVYELGDKPNFQDPHSGDRAYVFVQRENLATLSDELAMKPADLLGRLQAISEKLFDRRAPRKRPLLDNKILTGWNGLMIRGLADAGRYLKDDTYIESAKRTAEFVLGNLRTEDGRLLRTHTDGEAKLNAYLVDYAYLIDGLIAIHEATGDKKWIDEADALMQKQLSLFADKEQGGFFFTSDDHESLYARSKRAQDGARPSGNSMTAGNLAYLGRVLKNQEYLDAAKSTVLAFAALADQHPSAMPRMTVAAVSLLGQTDEKRPQSKHETDPTAPEP